MSTAVSWACLTSVAKLYNRSVTGQLTFMLSGVDESDKQPPMPGILFRLFCGGPFVCPKFRPSSVSLFVNEESHLGWRELLLLTRRVYVEVENIIAKGKGGRDLVKPALDGSYISPFDTAAEAIKVIEDALKAANATEHFFVWINFSAYKYWNKDISKYEFENFKKGSDPDEVEDLIAKLCLDKKIIKVVEDPFILEHKFSWHRLNVVYISAS